MSDYSPFSNDVGEGAEANVCGRNSTRFSFAKGNLVVRSDQGDPDAVQRAYTDPNTEEFATLWERQFRSFTGFIVGVGFEHFEKWSKFFVNFRTSLEADAKDYEFNCRFPSKTFDVFAKSLPNIDVKKPLQMSVKNDNKGYPTIHLTQDGKFIPWKFTRKSPNGMPEATVTELGGKKKYNYDEVHQFLHKVVVDWNDLNFGEAGVRKDNIQDSGSGGGCDDSDSACSSQSNEDYMPF